MTIIAGAWRLVPVLALLAAASTLAACAVGAARPDAARGPTAPTVPTAVSTATAAPTAPTAGRAPPTLLRFATEPEDALFRSTETVRLTLVLSNAEPSPLTVADLPPAVTLLRPNGERVRTFPGGVERVTLPPGGSYRHPIVWDGRLDDGSPAPTGRYSLALSTIQVGGGTRITAGAPGFVLHPADGVRLGELRPALSSTSEGVTMTLERLTMGEREARLEARFTPALPNRSPLGAPLGDWQFRVSRQLDGEPAETVPSPAGGVDVPGHTALTWTLDPLPATAQVLDLAVDLSGEARRRWTFRVPLAASAATGRPPAPPAGAPTAQAPQSRPAPEVWRPAANPAAADQGFQVVRLGAAVQLLGGPYGPGYVAAYVAFVAPPGEQAIPAPAAGRLRGVDSLGQRYAVEYTEIARRPGITIGAALLRGGLVGRKTLSLDLDALDVARSGAAPAPLPGRWAIGLVEQLVDAPRPSILWATPGGRQVVEANGARIHYASGFGDGDDRGASFAVERSGAAAEPIYVAMALATGAVRPLSRAVGDCYVARLHEPTPTGGGPPPTATSRPGPNATSTPAGLSCGALASASATPQPGGRAAPAPTELGSQTSGGVGW